jgi:biopolymer transport protein ExbD
MNFRDDSNKPKVLAMFSHSSLTDIVMLLLIFFLITSSFVTNSGIKVEIPQADSGAPDETKLVEVALTKEGRFYVGGKEVMGQSGLESGIVAEYNKNPMATLVLRADKAADFQYAVDVLSIGAKLGMKTVIATEVK